MGSSGGGSSNAGMMAMMGQGTPMPGLPIAGKDSTIGDAYEYGKFQNFLPDIKAEGPNDMATGLRPDMFQYKSPSGGVAEDSDSAQIGQLRDALAALTSKVGAQQNNQFGAAQQGTGPGYVGGYGNPYGDPFQIIPGGG